MTDNVNNEGAELEEASFDDFEGKAKAGTLGDLWRESSAVKAGVVVAGAVVILAAIIIFGKRDAPVAPSYVSGGSEVAAPPGTDTTSQAYTAAIEEENEARTEAAIKEGGSSLTTPVDPPIGRLTVTEDAASEEDPLQRWRKLQDERLQREMLRAQTVSPEALPEDPAKTEAVQALAEAMATQMQSILEKKSTPAPLKFKGMTSAQWLKDLKDKAAEAKAESDKETGTDKQGGGIEIVYYPAGTIAYAQILTESNSDVPGPVLAQIMSGPLAGSRILGSFSKEKELLTMEFSTVVIDGVSVGINGIALDPKTTLPAMATDVDHHYFRRVIVPMAAAFVGGLATAISESGRTDVTVTGETVATETSEPTQDQKVASGIEEAGQELQSVIEEVNEDLEVTVRVEAGTPIGVLFLEPVVKPADI